MHRSRSRLAGLTLVACAMLGLLLVPNAGAQTAAYYRYDALGRLIQASYTGRVITYTYDRSGNILGKVVAFDPDTDGDGIGNSADPDDDNDGALDANDAFPLNAAEQLDTDRDGIGNNADTDDDNDGISDAIEIMMGRNPLLNEGGVLNPIFFLLLLDDE